MKRAPRQKRARTEAREERQVKVRQRDKLMKKLGQGMPHDYQLQAFGKVVVL